MTSRVLRLCLEVTPVSPSGSHLPFIFIMHLVMVMRNVVHPHSDDETAALAEYLRDKAPGMKKMSFAMQWRANALGVSPTALDTKPRIMVRHGSDLFCVIVVIWQGDKPCTFELVSRWCRLTHSSVTAVPFLLYGAAWCHYVCSV